jgi:hypothetical protein
MVKKALMAANLAARGPALKRFAQTKMRDAFAPRIRLGFSPYAVGALREAKRPATDYRRFAFLAVLRGAFLAAFFLGAAFLAFFATFLAAFFAFLAIALAPL